MASSGKGFRYDLEVGQAAENKLAQLLGEGAKIEVKSDQRAMQTGNVFVEIESRRKPSGIVTTESDWWVQHLAEVDRFIILRTLDMRTIVAKAHAERGVVKGGDNNTSVGVLVGVTDLLKVV